MKRRSESLEEAAERRFREEQEDPYPNVPTPKSEVQALVDRALDEADAANKPETMSSTATPDLAKPIARKRDARATVTCLADVLPREVDWLWYGRLPAGMVSILDGEPASGKSTVVIDLIARITTGRPLPGEDFSRTPAHVVLIGEEDSAEHTVRPRLDAAGADVHRVHLLGEVGGQMLQLPDDAAEIERVVREKGARLLVIDPVSAYIGRADMHRDNEMRSALAPLTTIAERTGAAVLLLRHHRKSGGVNAINRGLGSIGIMALARAGLMLSPDPDDPKARILAWSKMSVAPLPVSLRCCWKPGEGQPRIEWTGTSPLTADQILDRHERSLRGAGGAAATVLDSAAAWVMNQFENAQVIPVEQIRTAALLDGVSWRTVERAKARLKIQARRESVPGSPGKGRWVWVAPQLGRTATDEQELADSKAAKRTPLAALTTTDHATRPKAKLDAELHGQTKTAKTKAANPQVAALNNDMDAIADALAEGPTHV